MFKSNTSNIIDITISVSSTAKTTAEISGVIKDSSVMKKIVKLTEFILSLDDIK